MPAPIVIQSLDLDAVWAAEPPVLEYVLPGLLVGTVGNVVAAGGTGKSVAMLTTALGIAIGRDIGDLWDCPQQPDRVVYLSLEDPDVALRARLHAFLPHLSSEERQHASANLDVLSYAGQGVCLAMLGPDKTPALTAWCEALAERLIATRTRLCVIDTLNRAIGGISENDGGAMGWMIGKLEQIASTSKCAIVVCHHVSKQSLAQGSAGEAQAVRGSSVITDNARWQANLWIPAAADEGFGHMTEVERQVFVRLAVAKVNYGAQIEPCLLHRDAAGLLSRHRELAPSATGRQRKTRGSKKSASREAGNSRSPDANSSIKAGHPSRRTRSRQAPMATNASRSQRDDPYAGLTSA